MRNSVVKALALAGPVDRERAVAVVRDAVTRLAPAGPKLTSEVLTDVVAYHRLAWRVTTSWQETSGRRPVPDRKEETDGDAGGTATAGTDATAVQAPEVEVRALAVVDAGPLGCGVATNRRTRYESRPLPMLRSFSSPSPTARSGTH